MRLNLFFAALICISVPTISSAQGEAANAVVSKSELNAACILSYFHYKKDGSHTATIIDDNHFNRIPNLFLDVGNTRMRFALGADNREDAVIGIEGPSIYLVSALNPHHRVRIGDIKQTVSEYLASLPQCPMEGFTALDYQNNAKNELAQPITLSPDLKLTVNSHESVCSENKFLPSDRPITSKFADSDTPVTIVPGTAVITYMPTSIDKFTISGGGMYGVQSIEITERHRLHDNAIGFLDKSKCELVLKGK